MNKLEIWKDVSGYEGLYQVSNHGKVKSLRFGRERILKPGINSNGYPQVGLHKDGKRKNFTVHRLVALCFISNPENKPQINHKDGDKTNNRVDNLEWNTRFENVQHAFDTGLIIPKTGSDSHMYGKTGALCVLSKKVIDSETGIIYECARAAANAIGMNYNTLAGYLNGQRRNKTSLRYLESL